MQITADSAARSYLNQLRLADLMGVQRGIGREQLPASFRCEWSMAHSRAAAIEADPSCCSRTKEMARILLAATFFVNMVPAGTQPNYYQYIDGRTLDWYLEPESRSTESLTRRSVNGIYALMKIHRKFETRSLDGLELSHREYLDETQIRRRIELIDGLLAKIRQFGGLDVDDPVALGDPIESFSASPSRLSALVHLTGAPLTQSHDEVLFVRVLQASELCFIGIRATVSTAIEAMKANEPHLAALKLRAAITFVALLRELLRVLRSMPVPHFATFRSQTGKASALQSIGFHLMDTLLHGVNTEKLEHFVRIEHLKPVLLFCDRRFVSLKQALQRTDENSSEWREVWAACRQLDKDLLTWRGFHLGFARLYIPQGARGTGGTSGAQYLQQHLFHGIFDDDEPDWDAVDKMFPELEPFGKNYLKPGILIVP